MGCRKPKDRAFRAFSCWIRPYSAVLAALFLMATLMIATLFPSQAQTTLESQSKARKETGVESLMESNRLQRLLTQEERQWLSQQGKLIYVSDEHSPPMRFVDPSDGQYKGVVIDYLNSLSLELGMNIETHPMVWKDALKALSEHRADLCDMFISEERSQHYLFSDPIYTMRSVLVVPADSGSVTAASDLRHQWIATQKGDYVNEYLAGRYPDIRVRQVNDVSEALELLKTGKVAAVAGDEPVVVDTLRTPSFMGVCRVVEKPLYEKEIVFGISKSKPQLLPIINKGIKALNDKRQLDRIQQKWFGISGAISTNADVARITQNALGIVTVLTVFVVGMFIWTHTLRNRVADRTKELNDSKEQLQTVFDGLTEYLAVVGPNGKLLNINQAFCKAFGVRRIDAIGQPCETLLQKFCGDCGDCPLKETNQGGVSRGDREVAVGSAVYAVRTYPLRHLEREAGQLLMVIQDITSDKLSKQQMLQTNKMVAVGQLAAGVAHEIRNPLGIIRSHSYLLRSFPPESRVSAMARSLDFIDGAVERAGRIIDNLLNFSRISGSTTETVVMKSFLQQLLEFEGKHLQKSNIEFLIDCSETMVCKVNAESLRHILINLIGNAADAMADGGKISLYADKRETQVALRVSDTGHGIPAAHLEKIFNPFFTTKAPGRGTGLGLYIVYSEVEKMNGRIEVQSTEGVGTTFEIQLPQKWEA